MREWEQRTAMLLGEDGLEKLNKAHVLLFGLGGVGSYAAEALARAGIGKMTIVDNDTIALSNLNRQLPALASTVGKFKTDVVAAHLEDAAPGITVQKINAFYLPESPVEIPADTNLVIDAIDTISAKLHLAQTCYENGIPLLSCMGMGNRLDPTKIRVGDINETTGCPLCRVMRRELRKRAVPQLRCVYSLEPAHTPKIIQPGKNEHPVPGSVSFVPSVAGLFLAAEAVRMLTDEKTI